MYLSLLLGVILISLALCADGAIGNVQEKAMKQHEASNTEIVRKIVSQKASFTDIWKINY